MSSIFLLESFLSISWCWTRFRTIMPANLKSLESETNSGLDDGEGWRVLSGVPTIMTVCEVKRRHDSLVWSIGGRSGETSSSWAPSCIQPTNWPTNQPTIPHLTNQPYNQLKNQPPNQTSCIQPTNWQTIQPTILHQTNNHQTNQPTDKPTIQPFNQPKNQTGNCENFFLNYQKM